MVRHPTTRRHPPTRAAADPQSPTQPRPRSRPGPLRIRQDIRRRNRRHLVAHGTRPSHRHRHHHPTITAVPKQHTTPSFPSFPIIRILVQTSTNARILSQNAPCDTTTSPSPQYPSPTTTVPSPASNHPSPSEGEIKRGSQGEGNRAAKGPDHPNYHPHHRNNKSPPSLREGGRERSEQGDARNSPQHPRHVIPADAGTQRKTKHAIHPNTPPQKPNHQPVSQFVPQFKTKPCTSTYMVLPNCTSHFHLTATAMLY